MKCPYCQSEAHDDALVCKACHRDWFLLKPLMDKVAKLEADLAARPEPIAYEQRISELEAALTAMREPQTLAAIIARNIKDVVLYLLIPLCLLLLAHFLITVVYDSKLIYLRVLSITLPLPFGYFLFKTRDRSVFSWFLGAFLLAVGAVLGMSAVIGLVDHTPILPVTAFEWREMFEYAASIAFGFSTGMLLGHMAFRATQQTMSSGPLIKIVERLLGGSATGSSTPDKLLSRYKKVEEYLATATTAGSSLLAAYTGLKSFF